MAYMYWNNKQLNEKKTSSTTNRLAKPNRSGGGHSGHINKNHRSVNGCSNGGHLKVHCIHTTN
ncbi:hypothetical protein DERF_003193 [Dermatophagoides farinae]|uniref:Uncharacterized protein n=1 Tax=Dermatophagoides farinae TaxID=6954 RepID=A0A922LCE9_DERFA|nr:hypothetical protein DERF_003193 [Dermatophagoides farinae]